MSVATAHRAMPSASISLFWALASLLAVGCSEVSPTNPFDPSTPAAQQAAGQVTGRAVLPAGFDASRLTDGQARLFALTAPQEVAYEADLVPSEPQADGRILGAFTLDSVPAASYRLEVFVSGAASEPLVLDVPIGGRVDVGEVFLDARGGGTASGVAHLDGAGIESHAGIVISVPGTSFSAVTNDEGAFRLSVSPGEHRLRASFPGYDPADADEALSVGRDQSIALVEPLLLRGRPGTVSGRIDLPAAYASEARFSAVILALRPRAGGDAVQMLSAGADGRFLFDGVPAGAYTASATLNAFGVAERDVDLPVAGHVDLGAIALAPALFGRVSGMAHLEGAQLHGGVMVAAEQDDPAVAFTQEDGTFVIEVLAGPARVLRFSSPGYANTTSAPLDVVADETTPLPASVLLAAEPGRVRGRLRLPQAFERADLLTQAEITLTPTQGGAAPHRSGAGPGGEFVLEGVGAGRFMLGATTTGFDAGAREVAVAPGAEVDVGDVVMEASELSRVRGFAQLAGAASHEGILIAVDGTEITGQTNADGAFAFRLPPGQYTLSGRFRDYEPVSRDLEVQPAMETVLDEPLVLRGLPGSLFGTVAFADGFGDSDALSRVSVALERPDDGERVDQVEPDERGEFLFAGVPAGLYFLRAALDGYVAQATPIRVEFNRQAVAGPLLLSAVENGAFVEGRAELLGAAEHGGIQVEVLGTPYSDTTEGDGTYRVEVPAGARVVASLRFSHAGYATAALELDEALPADRVLAVQDVPRLVGQPGRVQGLVLLDDRVVDRDLVQQIALRLTRIEQGVQEVVSQSVPSPQGTYVFDALGAGTYYVFASLPGFIGDDDQVQVGPGGVTDAPILTVLRDDGNLRGAIRGRVLRGGRGAGEHGGIRVEDTQAGFVTLTNGNGDFELAVGAGRDYTLRFAAEGYSAANVGPFEVEAADPVVLPEPVVMEALPGRVRGQVQPPDGFSPGAVLPGVTLSLERPDGAPVAAGGVDGEGAFLMSNVAVGDYSLAVSRAGFEVLRVEVTVAPAATTELFSLRLVTSPAGERPTVRGVARLAGRPAQENGGITLRVEGTPYSATSAADGAFTLEAIPGSLTVGASHPRYAPAQAIGLAVPVAGAFVLPQPLTLVAEPGRLRGAVRLPPGVNAAQFDRVVVRLVRGGQVVDGAVIGGVVEAQLSPESDGTFLFGTVAPGPVAVDAALADFLGDARATEVEPATTAEAGVLVMTLPAALQTVAVGVATLQGVVAGDAHGGIRVESSEYGLTTLTASDGGFRLELPRGPNTLTFHQEGYGTPTRSFDIAADAQGDVPVPGPNVLSALPGALTGTVSMTRYGSPDRVRVALVEVLGAGNVRLAQGSPAADGRFVLGNLASGNVTVRVTASGFETVLRGAVVPVGGSAEVGDVALVHKSEGPSAVTFAGGLLLAGTSDHSGTTVRLRLVNPDLPFAQVLTNGDGRFELAVAPDEQYRVSVQRNGFVDPALNTNWRWDAVDARVENEAGSSFDLTLNRSPLNGRVEVPVTIVPDWIPLEQQYVSVRLRGAALDQTVAQVTEANRAIFNNVPAGDYVVLVERAGFTSVQIPVPLDHQRPTALLPAVSISLVHLAAAQLDLSGRTLAACELRRAPVSFAGADLTGVTFTGDFSAAGAPGCIGAVLMSAFDFDDTNLTSADFSQAASLAGVAFRRAELFGANLNGRNLRGALLGSANLFGARGAAADFSGALLDGANLASAQLAGARFVGVNEALPSVPCGGAPRPAVSLLGASFAQADLTNALLSGTTLQGSVFSGARMRGAQLERACLEDAVLSLLDLTGANLDRADASRAQLTSAILTDTRLRGASLDEANLVGAVIQEADFRGVPGANNAACNPYPFTDDANDYAARCVGNAAFTDARCCRTNLRQANLNGANLIGARFDHTDLRQASLLGVNIGEGDDLPTEQPLDCAPEVYNDCKDACAALNACGLAAGAGLNQQAPFECESWSALCARGLIDLGIFSRVQEPGPQTLAGCLASAHTAGGCNALTAGPDPAFPHCLASDPYVSRPAPCSFAKIANPAANGACQADDIPDACLHDATSFAGARLDAAQMTAVTLGRAVFDGARLSGAFLRGAFVVDVQVDGATFTGADLAQSTLSAANLRGVGLRGANLSSSELFGAVLIEADLSGANLERADLRRAYLNEAFAVAPNAQIGPIRAVEADFTQGVLTGADLLGIDATDARFVDASMEGVSLAGGTLLRTNLTGAAVHCLDLDGAHAARVNLEGAGLNGVEARGADFDTANLRNVFVGNADFSDARLHKTDLTDADLGPSGACVRDVAPRDSDECGGAAPFNSCTSFRRAHLDSAIVVDTYLGGDFTEATLRDLTFNGDRAELSGIFDRAALYNVYLNGTVGGDGEITAGGSSWRGACLNDVNGRFVNLRDAFFDDAGVDPAIAACGRACTDWDGQVDADCANTLANCANTVRCGTFEDSTFRGASFLRARFKGFRFTRSDFTQANLTQADLTRSQFNTVDFSQATGTSSIFTSTIHEDSNFDSVNLTRPNFRGATFRPGSGVLATFRGADFNGATFQQFCGGNANFLSDGAVRSDLTNASFMPDPFFPGGDLSFADFVNTNMPGVNLSRMFMNSIVLDGVTATGANLTNTGMSGATIRNSNLSGANLRNACGLSDPAIRWTGVNFNNSAMCNADYLNLTGAGRCTGCTFVAVTRDMACPAICVPPALPAPCLP